MPNGNGNYDDIREILRKIAETQARHDAMFFQHSGTLAEHDKRMEEHDERMAEHDARMERVGRHLEVLATICDDLIRHKADRKKR